MFFVLFSLDSFFTELCNFKKRSFGWENEWLFYIHHGFDMKQTDPIFGPNNIKVSAEKKSRHRVIKELERNQEGRGERREATKKISR